MGYLKGSAWFLAMLAASLALAAASAQQGPSEKESRIVDPRDDVELVVAGQTQPAPEGRFDHVDLLSAWIGNESFDSVEFGLSFKTLDEPAPDGSPVGNRDFRLHFRNGAVNHTLQNGGLNCPGGAYLTSRIQFEGGGFATYGRCQALEVDAAANALRVIIPREDLINETLAPFGPLHVLTDVWAEGLAALAPGLGFGESAEVAVVDRAPDAGFGPDYHSTLGNVTGAGGLRLLAPEPIRVSNGEATTFVYIVRLTNLGDEDSTAALSVENAEPTFQIRTPARAEVAAGETITFPVILSMEFTHRHGEIARFTVRAQDVDDPGRWSQIQLGVYWLAVAQPAGHHDTLYLHSGPPNLFPSYGIGGADVVRMCRSAPLWINPEAEDSASGATEDDAPGCPPWDYGLTGPVDYYTSPVIEWRAGLNPALLIGLDFDMERTGVASFDIETTAPAARSHVEIMLEYCTEGCVALATGQTEPTSFGANSRRPYDIEVVPTPEADLVPYVRDSSLRLAIRLHTDTPMTTNTVGGMTGAPELVVADATLTLPLVEYHDPIDQAFQAVGSLRLEPLAPFEKPVNPGRNVRFPFLLSNTGQSDHDVSVALEGHHADWARVEGTRSIALPSDGRRNVTIVVSPPDFAAPGDRAELFLVVESVDDPNVVAISRLRATIVDPASMDVPDELAAMEDLGGAASGIGFVLGSLAAVGAVSALTLKRRHA